MHITYHTNHYRTCNNDYLCLDPFNLFAFKGGAGRGLEHRTEGCTLYSVGGACVFPAGRNFRGELSFVPSLNTESIGVRIVMIVPGSEQIELQKPYVSKEPIQAGKEYSLMGTGAMAPELSGKMITSKTQIYSESDKVVEACVEADFLVV